MMRDRWLPKFEVVDDLADAERFVALGEHVEDLDPGRVSECLEPARVRVSLGLTNRRRHGRIAAAGRPRHRFIKNSCDHRSSPSGKSLDYRSTDVNIYIETRQCI